uniref:Uncharacterized protein n=1 Tax=Odontella aurita TaxID=265563 RepID=A0A7S4IPZ8_9STRA|mmetsp:Transcript_28480/g.83823  ORF Transcript_28480/g.83823 Transcript_28480/m.83823 type:complete len:275 (+) Transcript_28480:200-1024(+)
MSRKRAFLLLFATLLPPPPASSFSIATPNARLAEMTSGAVGRRCAAPARPGLSSARRNDAPPPPEETNILSEWNEERNAVSRTLRRLEEDRLNDLTASGRDFRDRLRDSVEAMRAELLEGTSDRDVRTAANDEFIGASRSIKDEFRALREVQVVRIKEASRPLEELVEHVDEALRGAMMQLGPENMDPTPNDLKDFKAQIVTIAPPCAELFGTLEKFISHVEKSVREGTSQQHPEVVRALEEFDADVEDRLKDLRNDVRFRIRIMEDAAKERHS